MEIVVCVLMPRLRLTVAAGSRTELLGVPAALAPEPGGVQQVGEVTLAAEAFGVHEGMRLGEALARCPRLTLIPPDPSGVADRWEAMMSALEGIGAAVEASGPGLACFDARGLLRLHGGPEATMRNGGAARPGSDRLTLPQRDALRLPQRDALTLAQRDALRAVLTVARRALGTSARFGVAPSRFTAIAAADRARARRPVTITGGEREARQFLAPLPVALLRHRPELAALPEPLERLGVGTLGALAALPRSATADRFGALGLLARRLAHGQDTPLRPRVPGERITETLELADAADGLQLERVLALLIDRLLARRERRGRSLRAVVLSAALVERGGTWREEVTFRESLADPVRMRLALTPRLARLPAPALSLSLAAARLGPASGDQRPLLDDAAAVRAARLREAVRQARTAAGPEAALRILSVDPGSRLPERRAVLTPFEG